jgi:hypothetical protein
MVLTTLTASVGSQIQVPFPSPYTLESDTPAVVSVQLSRDGAAVTAVAPGAAWLTAGIAGDLQVRLQVTVVAAQPAGAVAAARPR